MHPRNSTGWIKNNFPCCAKAPHPHSFLPGLIRAIDMWLYPGLSAIQGDTDSPLQMGQLSLTGCLIKQTSNVRATFSPGLQLLVVPTKQEVFPSGVFLSFQHLPVSHGSSTCHGVTCDVQSTQENSLCFCPKGLKLVHPSGLPDGDETQPCCQDGLSCRG